MYIVYMLMQGSMQPYKMCAQTVPQREKPSVAIHLFRIFNRLSSTHSDNFSSIKFIECISKLENFQYLNLCVSKWQSKAQFNVCFYPKTVKYFDGVIPLWIAYASCASM